MTGTCGEQRGQPVRRSIALLDDHELVARGIAALLAPYHDVRSITHSTEQLIEFLGHATVELVLLDISMPDRNGLDLLPDLRLRWASLKVLILTMHIDRVLAEAAISLGADGYIPKDAPLNDLLVAIEVVAAGKRYVSPRIPRHTSRCGMQAAHPSLLVLTPRQQEILLLIGEGKSSAAIGRSAGLSESTITLHRTNIRRKLGIDTELGLYRYAALMRCAISDTRLNSS